MTDYDKLTAAVMTTDVRTAAQTFVDELISSTMLAISQDPRAYGFVTLKEHDARVSELLEANNREVERRRAAEAMAEHLRRRLCAPDSTVTMAEDRCPDCNFLAASVDVCTTAGCPVMAARKAAA